MVTVVDAINPLNDFGSRDFLRERGESVGPDDSRTLVDLLVEQIEFADVVVINKARDVGPDRLALCRDVVRGLNADARIVEADFGRVPLEAVLDTGLFDEETAQRYPLWYKELYGSHEHVPETEEYGISSFVYRARRPFHPQAFHDAIHKTWPGLIRAKGHFWVATRPNWVGELSIAGAICRVGPMGRWWAAVPKSRWPDHPEWRDLLGRHWTQSWGDRRQELVFIGVQMDETALRAALHGCLVGTSDSAKLDLRSQLHLTDPFPKWEPQAAA